MNTIKKLGNKITAIITFIVLVAVISITSISFLRNRKNINDYYSRNIEQYNRQFSDEIDNYFESLEGKISFISEKEKLFIEPFIQLKNNYSLPDSLLIKRFESNNYFQSQIFANLYDNPEIADIYLLDTESADPTILYQSSRNTGFIKLMKFKNIDNDAVNTHAKNVHINNLVEESGEFYTYVTYPIKNVKEKIIGLIVVKVNIKKICANIDVFENPWMNNSIHTEILKIEKNDIFSVYQDTLKIKNFELQDRTEQKVKEKWGKLSNDYSIIEDKNRTHLSHWNYMPEIGIAVLSTIEIGDDEYDSGNFNMLTLTIGFGIILISILMSIGFSRFLVYPICLLYTSDAADD